MGHSRPDFTVHKVMSAAGGVLPGEGTVFVYQPTHHWAEHIRPTGQPCGEAV